jgi:hypothetical protein
VYCTYVFIIAFILPRVGLYYNNSKHTQQIRRIKSLNIVINYDIIIRTWPHNLAAATVRCDNTGTANVGTTKHEAYKHGLTAATTWFSISKIMGIIKLKFVYHAVWVSVKR